MRFITATAHAIGYAAWLVKEIFVAGFTLAFAVLGLGGKIRPVIVYYPLRVTSEWEIFWFTTSITATPGTMSIGLREAAGPGQPRTLLVHAVLGEDPADVFASLADMEARLAPRIAGVSHGVPGQGSFAGELTADRYLYHPAQEA